MEKKDITAINIKPTSFPDEWLSSSKISDKQSGIQVGNAIMSEWFARTSGAGSGCRFYDRWTIFHQRRLYARGEQGVQKYKNELAVDGDLSKMNLDWTPVSIIPKFVDIVVNGMSNRMYEIKAYAQDAMSQAKRSAYQDMLEGQIAAKGLLEQIQQSTGVDPFSMPPDELPENDEEMSLHMQLKYKPKIEIAEEEAIITLLEENKYYDIKKQADQDMTVLGMAGVRHEFLAGAGVQISYVDPADIVHSYTKDPYFKDCFYWGEVKRVHYTECYKIKPDLNQEDIKSIKQAGGNWYTYFNLDNVYNDSLYNQETTTLLYFNYKTTKKVVFKKKYTDDGGERVIERDEEFNPPAEMQAEGKFKKIQKTIDVWYEGVMVAGTDIILKWEMAENMVRPKSSSQHAIPNYVFCAPRMYKGNIESTVSRMIPFADQYQIAHLKLQQVISKLVPDGVYIDADGLSEIDLGNGGTYDAMAALKLYFQTGSVIGRSQTSDAEFNHGKIPIQELNKSSGADKSNMLIGIMNHALNCMRDVTGLNEARDGSMPDPNSLVGLQKLAALNSNTATRHILDAGLFITRSVAEAMTYRIADILKYADFKDDFANKIGKYNVGILNEIKELYIYDFGIFIEVAPDEEQKAQLEANIQMALSKGDINLEDAIDIREIKNIKVANQLLKMKRIKKQQAMEQFEREKQMMQAQINEQAQKAASEAKAMEMQMMTEAKIAAIRAEGEEKRLSLQEEAKLKSSLMAEEATYRREMYQLEQAQIDGREEMKEKAKDNRNMAEKSAESKLIEQRKNNLPPINFESRQETLDGFSLQEFSV